MQSLKRFTLIGVLLGALLFPVQELVGQLVLISSSVKSQRIRILNTPENTIDGSLPSYIQHGWMRDEENPPVQGCGTIITFEVKVDGSNVPVNLIISNSERCSWRVDFGPHYFEPGIHVLDAIWCDSKEYTPATGCFEQTTTLTVTGSGSAANITLSVIEPDSGVPGDVVAIKGENLSSNLSRVRVSFDDMNAEVLSGSASALSVVVPSGLNEGDVSVRVRIGGRTSNAIEFKIDNATAPRKIDDADLAAGFMVGEVLIFTRTGISAAEIAQLRFDFGLLGMQAYPLLGLILARTRPSTTEQQTRDLVDALNRDPRVDKALLNSLIRSLEQDESVPPADPLVADQVWLSAMGYEHLSDYFPNGAKGLTIAVIDSGMDMDSETVMEELHCDSRTPQGINFASDSQEDPTGQDLFGHGTAVASIALAQGLNGLQGSGVAFHANLMPFRVFTKSSAGTVSGNILWVAEALSHAFHIGADVINLSLESPATEDNVQFYSLILDLLEADFPSRRPVIVAATGNSGLSNIACPACDSRIIAVGSIAEANGQWARSSFSNYSAGIDLVAQGEHVMSTGINGEFCDPGPGTSFAAPQVAGLAALILGENPDLTADEVEDLIFSCFVQDIGEPGYDEETGWGRLYVPPVEDAASSCLEF